MSKDSAEVARLLAFIGQQEKVIAKDFVDMVTAAKDDLVDSFKELFAEHRYNKIPGLMDEPIESMENSFKKVFKRAGDYETGVLLKKFDVRRVAKIDVNPNIDLSFNPGDIAAARELKAQLLRYIVEITNAQRKVIQDALNIARRQGLGAVEASRLFRDSIGLTQHQLGIVDNYKRLLQSGSADALDRVLRDRRFDATLGRAIRGEAPLTQLQIDRMTERYRERMIAMRAETIARTETLEIVSIARQNSLIQMAQKLDVPFNRIVRTWRTVIDGRERHTHHNMNGQKRRLKERFVSPSGAKLMYPGDRSSAPAREVINCRCVVLSRLVSPEEARAMPRLFPKIKPGSTVTPPQMYLPELAPPLAFDAGRVGSGLALDADYAILNADVRALEEAYKRGIPDYYIAPGTAGKVDSIQEAAKAGKALPLPDVSLADDGSLAFTDGRHRFAYVRDRSKQQYIPIAVPVEQREEFLRRFGRPISLGESAVEAGLSKLPSISMTTPTIGRISYSYYNDGFFYVPKSVIQIPDISGLPESSFIRYKKSEVIAASTDLYERGFIRGLTSAETEALVEYTSWSAWKPVNTYLRVGRDSTQEVLNLISALDSVMAKAAFPESAVVYRSIGQRHMFDKIKGVLKPGDTLLLDDAFVSTTLDRSIVKGFSENEKPLVLKILIPKGARAVSVGPVSVHAREVEVLINRGESFIVRDVKRNEITLELVI